MKIAQGRGADLFDFEGVNSPERGHFKLSFGGYLVQYHQVKINKIGT